MDEGHVIVDSNTLVIESPTGRQEVSIYSPEGFKLLSQLWVRSGWQQRLSYGISWMGVPVIQLPEDLLIMQEVIHRVRPDVVVETGTAHGGSAVFYASMLELLGRGRVISVDIEIRSHNRAAIESHAMSRRITLVEGDSVAASRRVREMIASNETVLVALDSNHSYSHVLAEMEAYAPLVTPGSYLVVFDGVTEVLVDAPSGRPEWASDNPARATRDFLERHSEFQMDATQNRLMVTYCPGGFLYRRGRAASASE